MGVAVGYVAPATTTVAVDLGGTHVRAALVTNEGEVLGRLRQATPVTDPSPSVVPALIDEVLARSADWAAGRDGPSPATPTRVVVGVPGVVDHEAECLAHAPNLPAGWPEKLSREWLGSQSGLTVSLANDADLAAVGESSFGAGRIHRDVLYVTISTGVGAGMVVDHQLVRGALSGGELGHTVIDRSAAALGQPATVEELGSGTAIARLAEEAGIAERGPALAELVRSGDESASRIWRSAIEAVGLGIANLAWVIAPQVVVIGGGVGMNADLVLPLVADQLRDHGPPSAASIQVSSAALGDDAGLVGAAGWWKALGRDQSADTADTADTAETVAP